MAVDDQTKAHARRAEQPKLDQQARDEHVVGARAAHDREPMQVEPPAGAGHDELVALPRPETPPGAGEEGHSGLRTAEGVRAGRPAATRWE